MNLRAFYENSGIDYETVLRRLMNKEELLEKYIKMFLSDSTFSELDAAVAAKKEDVISSKAHTLKGIAMNLDLQQLSCCCLDIVTDIRSGNTAKIDEHFEQAKAEYQRIVFELTN